MNQTHALFDGAEIHRASFVTIGTRVLVTRSIRPGETLDKTQRDAFRTLAHRGFDVAIVRIDGEGEPLDARIAPAFRALDAPEAFHAVVGPDAVRETIEGWLQKARRAKQNAQAAAAAGLAKGGGQNKHR